MGLSQHAYPESLVMNRTLGPIVQLCLQNSFPEAERHCLELIEKGEDASAASHLLAIISYQTGRQMDAVRILKELQSNGLLNPNMEVTSGLIAEDQRLEHTAIFHYEAALRLDPDHFEANWCLGLVRHRRREFEDAEDRYRHAYALRPADTKILINLGVLLKHRERLSEAEGFLRDAVRIAPKHVGALSNLGAVLVGLGNFQEAKNVFENALNQEPNNTHLLNHLGYLHEQLEQWECAEKLFRTAHRLTPGCLVSRNNIGRTLRETNRLKESELFLRETLDYDPDYGETRLNLALSLLQQSKFREGWKYYEFRPPEARVLRRMASLPLWQGQELAGERLLVSAEGGIGDMIQFSRYLILLGRLDCELTFEVPDRAVGLFENQFDGVNVVAAGGKKQGFDLQTRLMSLPLLTRNPEPWNPEHSYYLQPLESRKKHWSQQFSMSDKTRIGICWQGSSTSDISRDIPLEAFKPLAALKGVQLFSIQLKPGANELSTNEWHGSVIDLSTRIDKDYIFSDTSAIFANMHMVVSSDTGPAHLAGALGIRTCLALKTIPEWRWGFEGDHTPWYSNVRLFRRSDRDDWHSVLNRIAEHVAGALSH